MAFPTSSVSTSHDPADSSAPVFSDPEVQRSILPVFSGDDEEDDYVVPMARIPREEIEPEAEEQQEQEEIEDQGDQPEEEEVEEEGDREEDREEEERPDGNVYLEDQAEESGEDSEVSEEQEQDNAQDIGDEEDLYENVAPKQKKKSRTKRRRDNPVMEDELQLLEENLGVRLPRVKNLDADVAYVDDEVKKHSRLRKLPKSSVNEDVSDSFQRNSLLERADENLSENHKVSAENSYDDDGFIVDEYDNRVSSMYTDDKANYSKAQSIFGDFDFGSIRTTNRPVVSAHRSALLLKRQEIVDKQEALAANKSYADEIDDEEAELEERLMDLNEQLDSLNDAEPVANDLATLKQTIDPAYLSRKFLSEVDDSVRQVDIPERLQDRTRSQEVGVETEADLAEEADWIKDEIFPDNNKIKSTIVNVLRFIRMDHFEVPYIYCYKSEYWRDLPDRKLLWKIEEWDEKWDSMCLRKAKLREIAEKVSPGKFELKLLIGSARSSIELDDLQLYFRALTKVDDSNLVKLAAKIGLEPKQLAENILSVRGRQKHFPNSPVESPTALAVECINNLKLKNVDDVLAAARMIASRSLSACPELRRVIREFYWDKALISTQPTSKGISELDWLHPFYNVKCIQDKPAISFESNDPDKIQGHYALMVKAEQDGYITIKITIPLENSSNSSDALRSHLLKYYLESGGPHSKLWDAQREQIIDYSLSTVFYSMAEKYVRDRLHAYSLSEISAAAALKFESILLKGPYRVKGESVRVCSIVFGVEKGPCYVAIVDTNGHLLDSLILEHIKLRTLTQQRVNQLQHTDLAAAKAQQIRKSDDLERFQRLVRQHLPGAVIFEPYNTSCLDFKVELEQAIKLEAPDAVIKFADPTLSRMYKNTFKAKAEFSDRHESIRQAISLARSFQDPLLEVAHLWEEQWEAKSKRKLADISSNSVLSLRLHPQQQLVPVEQLSRALRRVLSFTVCQVGVDLNSSLLRHPYAASALLPFVAGLGPRKVDGFLRQWQQKGSNSFFSRKQLLDYFGPIVYRNCAGFIIVRPKSNKNADMEEEDKESAEGEISWFDATRIHPDNYDIAYRVVVDALEVDDDDIEDAAAKHAKQEECVALIRKPDEITKLDDLDFTVPIAQLEESGQGKMGAIFEMILRELRNPFRDNRYAFEDLSSKSLFYMLSGESENQIVRGAIVNAVVIRATRKVVICQLGRGGLRGIVDVERLSDERAPYTSDLDEKMSWINSLAPEGSTLTCRILEVKYESFELVLTAKPSDVSNKREFERPSFRDPYFKEKDFIEAPVASTEVSKHGAVVKNIIHFKRRNIQHPLFRNWTSAQTVDELLKSNQVHPIGSCYFRPSTKGPDHITLTWKFHDDICIHVDVIENQKVKDSDALGRSLDIGQRKFDDLDHIVAEYLSPMARILRELYDNNKFRQGSKKEIEEMLREEKRSDPNRTPYFLYVNPEPKEAGTLLLSCLPQSTVRDKLIHVTSSGFKFQSDPKVVKSVNHLISHFKSNFNLLFTQPASSYHAQRVPVPSQPSFGATQVYQGTYNPGFGAYHPAPLPSPYTDSRSYEQSRPVEPRYDHPSSYNRSAPPPNYSSRDRSRERLTPRVSRFK